jgi:hypothetical protein
MLSIIEKGISKEVADFYSRLCYLQSKMGKSFPASYNLLSVCWGIDEAKIKTYAKHLVKCRAISRKLKKTKGYGEGAVSHWTVLGTVSQAMGGAK